MPQQQRPRLRQRDGPRPARPLDEALAELLADGVYREEVWDMPFGERDIAFFELEGDTVWGATAALLRQLLGRVLGLGPDSWARPGW